MSWEKGGVKKRQAFQLQRSPEYLAWAKIANPINEAVIRRRSRWYKPHEKELSKSPSNISLPEKTDMDMDIKYA